MFCGYFPAGLTLERQLSELPDVGFREDVWPKFLRTNAIPALLPTRRPERLRSIRERAPTDHGHAHRHRHHRHDDRLPARGHEGALQVHHPTRPRTRSPRRTSSSPSSTCSRTSPTRSCHDVDDPIAVTLDRWTAGASSKGLVGVGGEPTARASSPSSATPTASSPRATPTRTRASTASKRDPPAQGRVGHPRRRHVPVGHVPAGRHQRPADVPDLRHVRRARHRRSSAAPACPGRGCRWRRSGSSSSTRSCTTSPS